jgi:RimJ/RimL family protein N-acetyltransferase/uncharacterized glyoxalase superfamily protein PhnB
VSETLYTERLILRPVSQEDLPAFFAILSDPVAMRFMPTRPHRSIEETKAWMAAEMSGEGAHYWAICPQDAEQAIGYVNFLGETRFPGMGYVIHRNYWGRGYATEACRTVLKYGFERLGYDRIELWIDETNAASLRVAQKLGFKPKGRIPQKYGHETVHHFMLIYGMLAGEWQPDAKAGPAAPASLFGVEPVLMVHDVTEAAVYYRDVLGFEIDFVYGDPANHASVSRGDWTGSTVTIQLARAAADRDLTSSSYLYILTDTSLDTLCDLYRERGVDIVAEPRDQPWGMREFKIRDLSGHTLVFGTHI